MRLLLICLLLPMAAAAQRFDISASAGVNQAFRVKGDNIYDRAGVRPAPAVSLKAWKVKKHFAYGVKFSAGSAQAYIYNGAKRITEIYGSPLIGVDLMVANKADFGKSRTVAGWQVGAVASMSPGSVDANTLTYKESVGFATGPIITYTYFINKFGVGMEFSPKVNFINNVTLITAPVLIGAHLKI